MEFNDRSLNSNSKSKDLAGDKIINMILLNFNVYLLLIFLKVLMFKTVINNFKVSIFKKSCKNYL